MPRHPRVSPTTESISSRVFSALTDRIARHPGPLYPLHVGDTWLEPLEAARAEAQRTDDAPGLHRYTPPQGLPELLAVIADRLHRRSGLSVDPACVQVVSGATSGLAVVCQTLLDPGDEVLLPSPFWPLVRGIIAARGAVPVQVPLFTHLGEPGFDLEAALEAAITPRTAALYVNSPHNPTGRILGPADIDAIARVATRHDLWVMTDEVYEELFFGDAPPPPVWAHPDLRDRAIATHSLSKAYGLAGARVGYTHGPPDVMKRVQGVHTFLVYCAARPMQRGAIAALRDGDPWLADARRAYRDAAARASAALDLPMPASGTFLFFDTAPWLGGGDDALPFLERCVDAGVILVPGASSGDAYRRWARLCFTSVPPDQLDQALERLRGVMR